MGEEEDEDIYALDWSVYNAIVRFRVVPSPLKPQVVPSPLKSVPSPLKPQGSPHESLRKWWSWLVLLIRRITYDLNEYFTYLGPWEK